ncbi:MAG: hypothetical protein DRI65_08855 [Chloroflexota bacterium]|nr:MAG: hypothetical protein DRI65_08855 [Chloroflexota bacterium]
MKITSKLFIILIVFLYLSSCSFTQSISGQEWEDPTQTPVVFPTPDVINLDGIDASVEVDSGKEWGQLIIQAINEFVEINGFYPDKLDELIPQYISNYPTTITDQKYKYFKPVSAEENEGELYILSFELRNAINVTCAYFPSDNEIDDMNWECGPTTTE